jgi:hypothetical protein
MALESHEIKVLKYRGAPGYSALLADAEAAVPLIELVESTFRNRLRANEEGGMSREQGPRDAWMRPGAIAAGRRQRGFEHLNLVKEAKA